MAIAELAEIIRRHVGYEGKLEFDATKPDGQMVKIFDVARLQSLGLGCATTLEDGLRRTIRWFLDEYPRGGVRL